MEEAKLAMFSTLTPFLYMTSTTPTSLPRYMGVLLAMTGFSGMYNQDTSPPTSGTHWQSSLTDCPASSIKQTDKQERRKVSVP
jgi:hypothetical protein